MGAAQRGTGFDCGKVIAWDGAGPVGVGRGAEGRGGVNVGTYTAFERVLKSSCRNSSC
jgi:hypothetical protein